MKGIFSYYILSAEKINQKDSYKNSNLSSPVRQKMSHGLDEGGGDQLIGTLKAGDINKK